VSGYIAFRLEAAGARRSLFTEEACALTAAASGGIPRMINVLCDTALVYAFAGNRKIVDLDIVRDVIADKQQHSMLPLRSLSKVR
jgi:type II secretory pathway predicted ATPase ExeA